MFIEFNKIDSLELVEKKETSNLVQLVSEKNKPIISKYRYTGIF
jgi:hypothetical protein